MTETVMQFKSVDDIIRFSRAAEQCTSHTYIMQGKTKIRADDLLAIFCVDYTVPVVVIHEDATEFAIYYGSAGWSHLSSHSRNGKGHGG